MVLHVCTGLFCLQLFEQEVQLSDECFSKRFPFLEDCKRTGRFLASFPCMVFFSCPSNLKRFGLVSCALYRPSSRIRFCCLLHSYPHHRDSFHFYALVKPFLVIQFRTDLVRRNQTPHFGVTYCTPADISYLLTKFHYF